MAQNYIRAGDVAEGCARLIDDFDEISTVESERLQTAIAEFVSELRSYLAVPEAREFLEHWTAV